METHTFLPTSISPSIRWVWASACACLMCFTLLIINSLSLSLCVCVVYQSVVSSSALSADSQGTQDTRPFRWVHHRSIQSHFLSGDILCLLPGPLKIECIFTTVGKGLYLIKCCPFKRLVLVSASSVLTGTLWNGHWDLDRSQTWESVQIKPCGQIFWALDI